VGKAKNLKSRVSSYFTGVSKLGPKTQSLVEQIYKIKIIVVESEIESLLLEAFYIKKFRPRYNIRLVDDKSYPLIKITTKEKYPVVLFAHKMDDPKATYFGPFPSSGSVKLVLRTLRRAFPYQSIQNHPKKTCLYFHLGLCPCPPVNDSPQLAKEYRKNIQNIIRVLEGKSKIVLKDLKKEMEQKSKEEKFEEAALIQKKIKALQVITEPTIKPFEYDINPNLRTDIRKRELDGLTDSLAAYGLKLSSLSRVECYDISNISGTNATGSLVVLTEGEIDKSQYRKFKIKKDGKPNDFAMMQEMLERRLKHTEWPNPNLVIVDGGKGQLTSALKAMKNTNIHFPVVGLAKREETIIIPTEQDFFNRVEVHSGEDGDSKIASGHVPLAGMTRKLYGDNEDHFVELSLPKGSPSLHLVERIRNEAHRFAITYHRNLRSKATLS